MLRCLWRKKPCSLSLKYERFIKNLLGVGSQVLQCTSILVRYFTEGYFSTFLPGQNLQSHMAHLWIRKNAHLRLHCPNIRTELLTFYVNTNSWLSTSRPSLSALRALTHSDSQKPYKDRAVTHISQMGRLSHLP